MYRPNKIDWFVYSIFRWWWNPIFSSNPKAESFLKLFQMHMKDKVVHVPNPFWWH